MYSVLFFPPKYKNSFLSVLVHDNQTDAVDPVWSTISPIFLNSFHHCSDDEPAESKFEPKSHYSGSRLRIGAVQTKQTL